MSEPEFSGLFTAYLLSRNVRIQEDLVDHLFNSAEKRLARAAEMSELVRGAAWGVHDLTDTDVRDLGISVYKVKRNRVRFWREHLKRVSRERVNHSVPSGIVWQKGIGVVGLCWKKGKVVHRNLEPIFNRHRNCTPEQWAQLPEKTTMGMSHADFMRTADKYGTIVAVPIVDANERFVGCISLDAPAGSHDALTGKKVVEALGTAGQTVARLL